MHRKANPLDRRERPSSPSSLLTREPLLLLALLLAVFYFGRPLLVPLALALTLNFLLTPVVSRLERLPLRRTPAALLVLAAATALVGGLLWLVAGQLLTVVNNLPSHAPNIRAKLDRTHVPASSALGQALISMEGLSRELSGDPAQQDAQQRALAGTAAARARSAAGREAARRAAVTGAPQEPQPTPVIVVQAPASEFAYLRELLRPVVGPLGTAGMVLIFTVYMLIKREDLRNRLLLLAGIGRLNLVSHALDDAAARISRYLIANAAVNISYGIVFAAGLYAIGIPYATLWGALLAILRTIPYVGALLGGGLPTLFALIYFATWWQAGSTLALIVLLEILVSNFLEPWLYGAHTGISELALLAMAILWTLLWGWPGLALSTPLTVCLIVVGRTMPQLSFLHILLGDNAELAPEARFYERMLAMDQAEAHSLAARFLAGPGPLRRRAGRAGSPRFQPLRAAARPAAAGTAPAIPSPVREGAARTPSDLYDTMLLPALALAESDRHKGLLDEPRAAFFMQSAAELIAELTTFAVTVSVAGASPVPLHHPEAGSIPPEPRSTRCPVVCIPACDQADEIAATMLAQVLEAAGHKTLLLPPAALTPDLLRRFAAEPDTTLCISALPPLAFSGARTLFLRLRAELPANPILIGLWRSTTPLEELAQRFGIAREEHAVANTLAGALRFIERHDRAAALPDIYARTAASPAFASR